MAACRHILLLGRDHLVYIIHHNITPSDRDYRTSGASRATLFGGGTDFAARPQIL
jgi:hypothetical protein